MVLLCFHGSPLLHNLDDHTIELNQQFAWQ